MRRLSDPRPFALHPRVRILRPCDAFVTNFVEAEFRALYCTSYDSERVQALHLAVVHGGIRQNTSLTSSSSCLRFAKREFNRGAASIFRARSLLMSSARLTRHPGFGSKRLHVLRFGSYTERGRTTRGGADGAWRALKGIVSAWGVTGNRQGSVPFLPLPPPGTERMGCLTHVTRDLME
ncbi:hypothetical protein EVAR_86816_1 [Eumeta japonica]|uniref:Uncharacterized protein n=1 Tax=Eumeta variegata TaxID=151549 RepID=A0A4C1VRT6_EUMVA|nr:hypothetical protein EVAR_86816_1 [Eumeta japonica]